MTQGQILRTNYRKTGGAQDILAFGGHLLSTCMFGDSAGFRIDQYPNGGFMYISVSGSIQGAEATAAMWNTSGPTGCSRAWIDSTYGLISRWNGNPAEGYVFYPVEIDLLSFSDVGLAAGNQSVPMAEYIHYSHSGSIIFVSMLYRVVGEEPWASMSMRGTAEFKAHMWGFIISAP